MPLEQIKNQTILFKNSSKIYKISKSLTIVGYYFGIPIILIITIFIAIIIVLLIRRKLKNVSEKMIRIKLQKEINKIMNLDIFESSTPTIDLHKFDFHSINNDSSISDLNISTGSVFSENNNQNGIFTSHDTTNI